MEVDKEYKIDNNQIECVKHWREILNCSYRRIATLFRLNFPEVDWVTPSCQWSGAKLCEISKAD